MPAWPGPSPRPTSTRGLAEEHLRLARLAVDGYITRTAEDERLKAQDLEPLRRDLLTSAAALYRSLAERRSASPAVQAERGWACYRLGVLTREVGSPAEAVGHFEEALEVFRRLAPLTGRPSPTSAPARRSA